MHPSHSIPSNDARAEPREPRPEVEPPPPEPAPERPAEIPERAPEPPDRPRPSPPREPSRPPEIRPPIGGPMAYEIGSSGGAIRAAAGARA
jgi:hypothetical protein